MADSIRELWKQTPPTRVVILGKGPSLNLFEPDEYHSVGWALVGINEAAQVILCDYVVAGGDPGDDTMRRLDVSHQTIPLRYGHCCITRFKGCHPEQWFNGRGYCFGIDQDIPSAGARATVAQAISVFATWARIHHCPELTLLMVGCDSFDARHIRTHGYADRIVSLKPATELSGDYSAVNHQIDAAIAWHRGRGMHLNLMWFHRSISREASPEH